MEKALKVFVKIQKRRKEEPKQEVEDKLGDLKRCLVHSFYGTEYGPRASAETRAEIFELVNQLEVENPTSAPTETPKLLMGIGYFCLEDDTDTWIFVKNRKKVYEATLIDDWLVEEEMNPYLNSRTERCLFRR